MNKRYPEDHEIKVRWTKTHISILVGVTVITSGLLIYEATLQSVSLRKWLTIIGLYIDIVGVVIASLKTPFYGIFYDAGEIEEKRHKKEVTYFQAGMFTIAAGVLFQVISNFV